MAAYYNEIDPYAAEWLRNLIRDGHIADGEVDTQSIEDIQPHDLRKFTQCHFFAGVGLWSLALRLAGWADDRPIWTGSCPCQPFSAAGKGDGFDDERHLWPAFQYLASVERPGVICGEQVASKDGYAWLDLVSSDLEGLGYAFWPVVFPAASVGAPNERHRTYWVGLDNPASARRVGPIDDAKAETRGKARLRLSSAASGFSGVADADGERDDRGGSGRSRRGPEYSIGGGPSGVADAASARVAARVPTSPPGGEGVAKIVDDGSGRTVGVAIVADASSRGLGIVGGEAGAGRGGHVDVGGANVGLGDASRATGERDAGSVFTAQARFDGAGVGEHGGLLVGPANAGDSMDSERPGPLNGHWRAADWLFCTDGKWRPVEPGSFPLAYGLPRSMGTVGAGLAGLYLAADVSRDTLDRAKRYRVGSLRGYGNAINPQQAAEFIRAWMDAAP